MNHTSAQVAAAVYQACTTYDQYLPQLSPDVARSWGKAFAASKLSAEELLNGVDKVYQDQGAGYRPLPADIVKAAKALRVDRIQKESYAELEARQERYDKKAADEVREVSAAFLSGRVKETPRLKAAREALDTCRGKRESIAALKEFFAAKAEAAGKKPKRDAS